jgi:hypothetical protein
LREAKRTYYYSVKSGFGYNDEKVMSELVLYGLPMHVLRTGGPSCPTGPASAASVQRSVEVSSTQVSASSLSSQGRTYYPQLELVSGTTGLYYQAVNADMIGGMDARANQPIQPRLMDVIDDNARGVVFEGGRYAVYVPFDPVVTQVGNWDAPAGEEGPITGTQWLPSQLVVLNGVEILQGMQQRLVVLAGQYRGADAQQRVYQQIEVTLYASTSSDWQVPEIESVTHSVRDAYTTISVTATDGGGIHRVVVAYTNGKGEWRSLDLANAGGDTWRGTLQSSGDLEYLVQVVDGAGNVAVDDGDGSYYRERVDVYPVYLPLVLRAYEP